MARVPHIRKEFDVIIIWIDLKISPPAQKKEILTLNPSKQHSLSTLYGIKWCVWQ
jgi:hypothetical protein